MHMTGKVSHLKNTFILKAFQTRVKWRFSFCDIFFVPEIFKFSYYASLATDDLTGSAITVVYLRQ